MLPVKLYRLNVLVAAVAADWTTLRSNRVEDCVDATEIVDGSRPAWMAVGLSHTRLVVWIMLDGRLILLWLSEWLVRMVGLMTCDVAVEGRGVMVGVDVINVEEVGVVGGSF